MTAGMRRGVRLGVDVGSVRVGLAACDADGLIATPVETVPRDEKNLRDLARIAEEAAARGALEVVVGLPRSMDGREGSAAQAARGYAVRLAGVVAPVPVRLVDERLSTVSAHRALHDSGVRGRRHRRVVDQVAAVLILQSALDAERSSGLAPGSVVDPVTATDDPGAGTPSPGPQEAPPG